MVFRLIINSKTSEEMACFTFIPPLFVELIEVATLKNMERLRAAT